jgi:hypothetical protein
VGAPVHLRCANEHSNQSQAQNSVITMLGSLLGASVWRALQGRGVSDLMREVMSDFERRNRCLTHKLCKFQIWLPTLSCTLRLLLSELNNKELSERLT